MLNINVSDPKGLERAIRSVSKFADTSAHNSLPTQNILVETADKGLRLTATDLYKSVEFAVNSSEVFGEGEFCIPAKNLLKLGEIIKDQSAIGLQATETGVNLKLSDVPDFVAKFKTSETGEFPMTAKPDPKAHWIEFDAEHIAIVKALVKYANTKERGRVGYDAVQFATYDNDTLYAYTTDGKTIAYAKLGRTLIPNFAIPAETVKKAFQVMSTPELKNSTWRVTVPTEDNDVVSIQIADTAVKSRAGDAIDLTDWIVKHITYHSEDSNLLAFDPKALTAGLKKVSKLFVKENRVENIVVIDVKDGKITMTAKAVKTSYFSPNTAVNMPAEYIHEFKAGDARCVQTADEFQINVDGAKFQSMVKDLTLAKAEKICVAAKYAVKDDDDAPSHDRICVSGTSEPIGFLTMPQKL